MPPRNAPRNALVLFAFAAFAALAALALLAFPGAAGAQSKPFEQLVPEGSLVFASLRDLRAAEKWLESSPFQETWKHADVQALVKALKERFEKEMTSEGKESQRDFADFWSCLGGELAFVVGDLSKADPKSLKDEPPLAVLANVGRDKDKARETIRKLNQKARDKKGNNVSEMEFRGQKITVIQKEAEKDAGPDKKGEEPEESDEETEDAGDDSSSGSTIYNVQADDLFVFATSKTVIQDILANRTEAAVKPLAESADYKLVREKVGRDSALLFYVSLSKGMESLSKLAQASGEAEAQQIAMFLPGISGLLGLVNLKGFGFGMTLGKDEVLQQMYLSISGPPRGLLKAFWTRPGALKLPALIPDDVDSATVAQFSPEALWEFIQGVARFAGQFLPRPDEGDGAGGPADPISQAEQMLGISFKQDLIAPMGGQLLEFTRFKKPYDLTSQQTAILLEIKDRERFQATIDKLLASVPFFKKSDYLGRALYTFGMGAGSGLEDEEEGDGDEPKAAGSGSGDAPALAITENHFVFGMKRALAEEVIRRVGKEVKSINDAPGFKAVASHFPASAIVISYTSAQYIEYVMDVVRDAAKSAGEGGDEDAEIGQLLAKLPAGAVFAKPIAGFISHATTEETGMSFTSKLLFKKKE